MKVELLVVPECPNAAPTAELLRRALDDVGMHATGFTMVVIADHEVAERVGFTGSPTVRIDGMDPFAEPGCPPGLSCRRYLTTNGLAGTPDVAALRQALKHAANHGAGDLRAAVEDIWAALILLRADPRSADLVGVVDQVRAAVAALERDLMAEALRRLLINIEECHRAGMAHSPELEASCRTVTIALLIDPRWV